MDERTIKRLLVTLLVAIAIIMLAKFMLTKTYSNLNKAAAVKNQAVVIPAATPQAEATAEATETPLSISSVDDAIAVSAVESTDR